MPDLKRAPDWRSRVGCRLLRRALRLGDGKLAYVVIRNAGSSNGGIMPMTEQHGGAPPYWLAYFTVPSCDAAAAKVRKLGGGVLAGPLDVPNGRIAAVRDSQGVVFALFEGETDD
jgi:predicted enzyme related to lactoylglutathione lyase